MQEEPNTPPFYMQRVATAGKPKPHVITAITARPSTAANMPLSSDDAVSSSGQQNQGPNHLNHINFRNTQTNKFTPPPLPNGSIHTLMNNAAAAAASKPGFQFSSGQTFLTHESEQTSSSKMRSDGTSPLLSHGRRYTENDGSDDISFTIQQSQRLTSSNMIRKDPQVRLHQDPRSNRVLQNQSLGFTKVVTSIPRTSPNHMTSSHPPSNSNMINGMNGTSNVHSLIAHGMDEGVDDRFNLSRIQSSMRRLATAVTSSDSSLTNDTKPSGSSPINQYGQERNTIDFSSLSAARNASAAFGSKILSGIRPKPIPTVPPFSLLNPSGGIERISPSGPKSQGNITGTRETVLANVLDPVKDDLKEAERISPGSNNTPPPTTSGRVVRISVPSGSNNNPSGSSNPSGGMFKLADQFGTLTAFPASQFHAPGLDGERTTPDDKDKSRDVSCPIEPVSPGPGSSWGGGGGVDRSSPSRTSAPRSLLSRNNVPINVPTSSFETMANSLSLSGSSRLGPMPESRPLTGGGTLLPKDSSNDSRQFNSSASGRNRRSSQVLDRLLTKIESPEGPGPSRKDSTEMNTFLPSLNHGGVESSSKGGSGTNTSSSPEPFKLKSALKKTQESQPMDKAASLDAPGSKKLPLLDTDQITALLGGPVDLNHSKAVVGYSVGQVIGEGGFCEVRIGVHHNSQRKVAIKIVDRKQLVDPNEHKRMQREIRVMKHLQHESVVKLFEVVETEAFLYLVMENCPNGTLLDHVRGKKKLQEAEAAYLLQQIVAGLQHCHKREVVHRDIKLENILVSSDYEMKIIDFGLSAFFLPGKMLRVHCGSPSYAAPEIVARKQYEAAPVDVWSLGIVFFAMLSGYLPFYSNTGNKQELCDKILAGKFGMPEHVSPLAGDLLLRMLSVDPSKRITFEEFWSHPWIQQSLKWEPTGLSANTVRTDTSTGAVYADEQLLEAMENLGYSRSAVLQSLLLGEFNSLTACYYLLAETKIEEYKHQRAYVSRMDFRSGPLGKTALTSPTGSSSGRGTSGRGVSSRIARTSLPSGHNE